MIPSLLLLIKVSLGEKLKSLRRQGGGVGGRAAETPLQRRRMQRSGNPAVGHRQMGVVGGSGDQNGQGTQDQQNRTSRMKNIFLELKLSVTPKWDSLPILTPMHSPKANAVCLPIHYRRNGKWRMANYSQQRKGEAAKANGK